MTKKSFVLAMEELHEAYNNCNKYYDGLEKLGVTIDDAASYQFLDVALSILSREIDDTYGYVQFFVFEMDWGETDMVYDPLSDRLISIHTYGELYNYIKERNNAKEQINDETR